MAKTINLNAINLNAIAKGTWRRPKSILATADGLPSSVSIAHFPDLASGWLSH
jgi:hypothetical protein